MRQSIRRGAKALLAVGVLFGSTDAQIPNPSFENWVGGNPVGWNTSNDSSLSINVTQTASAHAGASAAHGVVTDFGGGFAWSPMLNAGQDAEGFPVNTRHQAVRGWYKFSPGTNDQLFITAVMIRADTGVGGGAVLLSASQSLYTEFVVNITYISNEVPDTCSLSITIINSGGLSHVGSSFDIDDLAFGAPSTVGEGEHIIPSSFKLFQNYPNPFNPTTEIQFHVAESERVLLNVYDALGKQVATLVNEQLAPGSYKTKFDAANLPSGVYFYRLQAGNFLETKKLIFLR